MRHWKRNHGDKTWGKECPICNLVLKDININLKHKHPLEGEEFKAKLSEVSSDLKPIYSSSYFPPGNFKRDGATVPEKRPSEDPAPGNSEVRLPRTGEGSSSQKAESPHTTTIKTKGSNIPQSLKDALNKEINYKLLARKGKYFRSKLEIHPLPGCQGVSLFRGEDLERSKVGDLLKETWEKFRQEVGKT